VKRLALVLLLSACPKRGDKPQSVEPQHPRDAAARVVAAELDASTVGIPEAAPLPAAPSGLPAAQLPADVTPAAVALGEVLFHDVRLSANGKVACATCHDPAHGFAGTGRQETGTGKPNLRRAPPLVNLAWQKTFGWDGRYDSLPEQLAVHWKGQLGTEPREAVGRVADLPLYQLYFAALGATGDDAALDAVRAYVLTRYAVGAPWDRLERSPDVPPELAAGYAVFSGKAQCSVCHTPPLYTDRLYHRLGLISLGDEGRGRVDHARAGAFKTPTLRGAAARTSFFHDGSAKTLDEAIDWHLAGGTGQGADPSIVDLKKISLTPSERAALGAFVRALTADSPAPRPPAMP
jgi:cytochrome c peroxidase